MRLLDGELCFKLWVELDSLDKVSDTLYKQGVYNPKTGGKIRGGSIANAANKWILQNTSEARKIFLERGSQLTDQQWQAQLVRRASRLYYRLTFIAWVKTNPWALDYPQLFERRWPGLASELAEEINKDGHAIS